MFIEDVLAEQRSIWGTYHPKRRDKSCVMVRNVGCVFVGTVGQCQDYIRDNEWRYEKSLRRLLTV